MQGTVANKGRQMQRAVRDAAQGVTEVCAGMRGLEAQASHSNDRCSALQSEVSEQSAAAASAHNTATHLRVCPSLLSPLRVCFCFATQRCLIPPSIPINSEISLLNTTSKGVCTHVPCTAVMLALSGLCGLGK